MATFRLTNKAKTDLINIARYTETQWGVEQRNLYLKQFDDAFHLIADKPNIGQECHYIKKHYRKFPQGSHIIFYKDDNEHIEIIRLLHKSMDVTSKL